MKFSKETKIGIAGLGFLGGALKYWFDHQGFQTFAYDKYKEVGTKEDFNSSDVVFVCVPTPYDQEKGFDDSAVLDVLKMIEGEKVVVIRSTVLPGSTAKYQKLYPQHKFLMIPEFLVAKSAITDFMNPHRQVVGHTASSKHLVDGVLAILPKAGVEKVVSSTEAEMIKYFGNTFLANRIIFANQMYDLCQKVGADYEVVKEAAGLDPRIGNSHFDVLGDGYRGYAGACLPKDTKALIQFAKQHGLSPDLLEAVDKINTHLVNNSNHEKS